MSGPFRELWVDAGEAIAEALREAVRSKLDTRDPTSTWSPPIRTSLVLRALTQARSQLAEIYQFSEIRVWRDEASDRLVIVALGPCGHKAWDAPHRVVERISEQAIEGSDDLPGLIHGAFKRMRARRCTCD